MIRWTWWRFGKGESSRSVPSPLEGRGILNVKQKLLERINKDRREREIQTVAMDYLASRVGDAHCREMLEHGYQSHWNLQGHKPYHRYSLAGGTDSVHENCGSVQGDFALHRGLDDVLVSCIRSYEQMMAERPPRDGHRRNILDGGHTHVGIGLAYNSGRLCMTHEFVKRYVILESPVTRDAVLGQTVRIAGRVLNRSLHPNAVAVCYEPIPRPMTVAELNRTYSCGLPDTVDYEYPVCKPGHHYSDGSTGSLIVHADGRFECPIRFRRGKPGLYTICVWLKGPRNKSIGATNLVLRVKR